MAETGISRFPGSLDPRAEEFRPRNPSSIPNQVILFGPPPPPPPPPLPPPPAQTVYYPYGSPYPTISEVQVLPFGDVGCLGYNPQFSSMTTTPAATVAMRLPVPATSAVSTRAVMLSSVPSEVVSETMVRRELEAFGEVRCVQMERLCDGIVTVHFYDLRHAENALREIREQHMQHQNRLRNYHFMMMSSSSTTTATTNTMRNLAVPEEQNWAATSLLPLTPLPPPAPGLLAGRAVWAQFVIPATNSIPDGYNQGTIVIFNLNPEVTASTLKDTFQVFGHIKELRETPSKKHQKFIEFFDVRDAAKALKEMNGKEINGKEVVIEFSRPGGHNRKIINAITTSHKYPPSSPPPPLAASPVVRKFSGRASFNVNIPPRSYAASQAQFPVRKSSFGKGNSNGNKGSSSSGTVSSVERKMASINLSPTTSSSTTSLCNGAADRDRDSHGRSKRFIRKAHHSQASQASNHQSPPSPSIRQQQQPQTPAPRSKTRKVSKQGKKFDTRFLISEEAMAESNCRDSRTTVMIKNIPNKYSQKLLLNMLDNHCIHCNEQIASDDGNDQPFSSYDFLYLPIDFNNKCNVGYGFVNMTSPEATWRLYKAFHLQHWEVFNSRKICEVTYARVQGLEALKEHFKNSKFPCEMDHYLPVVFSPPRDGRQLTEPLPIVGQKQTIPIGLSSLHDDHDRDQEDQRDEILDGQDDHDHKLVLDNENDVSDCSNDEDEDVVDVVVADQVYGQLLLIRHDNSTGCSSSSSKSLNGGVMSASNDDDDDDVDQDSRQRYIYV